MTGTDISALQGQIVAVQTTLQHIEKMMNEAAEDRREAIALSRELETRVTRLEERMVPRGVVEANTLNTTASEARVEERERGVDNMRRNIGLIVTIAASVGSIVGLIVSFIMVSQGNAP